MDEPRLSDQLETWFASERPKTVGDLVDSFGPGSFAVAFVLLLAFPALPLPTGGVSHVLEVVAMLLALELIAGRREVWIPARWQGKELRGLASPRVMGALLRRIRWVERHSRPRLARVTDLPSMRRVFGAAVFGLSLAAFLAPPFSGLDTLPALGVVVLSLGVMLHDAAIATLGSLIGALGVVLTVGLGSVIVGLF